MLFERFDFWDFWKSAQKTHKKRTTLKQEAVTDLRIWVRAERLSDQPADKIMFSFSAAGQANTIVSFVVFKWRKQLRHCMLQALAATHI